MGAIVTFDTRAFVASLDDFAKIQLLYAMSRTVNELGKLAQFASRNRTGQIWDVRRKAWVDASVKITKFSDKYEGGLSLILGIHPPGGDARADILTKFETETVKLPHAGTHVVIPIGINEGRILREGQRFSDYHFVRHGKSLRDDAHRAFILPIDGGKLLVLQRVDHRVRFYRRGKQHTVNKGDAQPLFVLVPNVPIRPDLQFEQTVREVVEERWEPTATYYLNDAIASAR